MISEDSLFARNFHPELSRLNRSGYKEDGYPGTLLLRVLHAAGKLDAFPSRWHTARRPEVEFYDLKADPPCLHDVNDVRLMPPSSARNSMLWMPGSRQPTTRASLGW